MSDRSQGPGWWLASDGKWYPPDQAPAVPPPETWATPPAGPPPSPGMSTSAKVAIAVAGGLLGLVVLSVLAVMLLGEEAETSFSRTGPAIDGGDSDDGGDGGGPPADVPGGLTTVEGDGVSIGVPEGWEAIAPDDFTMSPEEFERAFPDAPPELLEQATSAFSQGAKLVAFDVESPGFSSNVNIASFPGEAPLSLLESQAANQLEALDGTVVSSETVAVPAGDAIRIEYTLEVAGPGGDAVTAHGVQYYVHSGGRTHVVAVTTDDGAGDLADAMIETFRTG